MGSTDRGRRRSGAGVVVGVVAIIEIFIFKKLFAKILYTRIAYSIKKIF
jgi:hypothetical protein